MTTSRWCAEHRRPDRPLEVLLAIRRCAGVAVFLYATATHDGQTQLVVPFLKDVMPQLGLMFIVLTYFVIVGTSNAVNLTDGLDGLAIMPTVMVAGGFAFIAWATGNVNFANYLHIPYVPYTPSW